MSSVKESRDHKDSKGSKGSKDSKVSKDSRDSRDSRDSKERKSKSSKEDMEIDDKPDASDDERSVRTDDLESDSDSMEDEEDFTVRLVEKDDIALRDSLAKNAGKGVFCKRDISAGTILPYYALIKKLSDVEEEEDDTFFMSVTYVNDKDKTRNILSMIADGNPSLKCIKALPRQDRAASFVNEASDVPPNCVFVNNLILTKNEIVQAYREKKPIPITFLVIPHDLEKGEELYTMYGSDYTRDYKVWRDRKGFKDAIVNLSHEICEECKDDIKELFESS